MSFLEVKEGKNTHPRYIWSLVFIFILINVFAIVYYMAASFSVMVYDSSLLNDEFLITNPTLSLYVDLFYTVFIVLSCFLAVRWILKRKFLTLITPKPSIQWNRIFSGFGIFFILLAIINFSSLIINPEHFRFNITNWNEYAFLVLAALVLVPIQTTSEELVFRGILLQWLAKFTRNPIILGLIVGAIFGGLHFFNPEMSYGWILALDYLFTGFILTYVTVKTNSLEYAIGAHAANNMFLCLFFTIEENVMGDIPSMFLLLEFNAYTAVISSIIMQTVFAYIVLRIHRKENQTATEVL